METISVNKGIHIIEQDITQCDDEAIVNAANTGLWHGGGVDDAIRTAAGRQMDVDLAKVGHVDVGGIVVTEGYRLKQKYVFHTAGPDCADYNGEERPDLLSLCYKNALDKARELDVHSIAFPCISTGIFGYEKNRAAKVALKTVNDWLEANSGYDLRVDMLCYFNPNHPNRHDDLDSFKKAELDLT
jgi:O-acetyl-ADP-ribose deacetylase (regulator of RNase III)